MLAAIQALGVQVMPFAARVRSDGSAWRLPAGRLLRFTHQALAELLGVQRNAISIAAGKLQRRDLIH